MAAAAATSASAAAGRAAPGGSNPNPSANNGRSPRLPGRPVALADITNTGKPNPPRSVSVADALKENAKLAHLIREKTKFIELSKVEMHKLRLMLQSTHQQNVHLAQTNSQLLMELNQEKDKVKELRHELACTKGALKAKASELEQKNKTSKRPQKKVSSQEEIEATASKLAPEEAHLIESKTTGAGAHHSAESQSAEPSNTGCQEPPQDTLNRRRTSKRKPESCEAIKDTITVQHNCKSHLQPSGSLHPEEPRKSVRRKSARLNPECCEVTEVSYETLHEEAVVPSAPSSFSVKNMHDLDAGKDMSKSLQNELPCTATAPIVKVSELKQKNETNMQPPKEAHLEEIQESSSMVAGVDACQIGDNVSNNNIDHLAKTESSVPCNIERPELPQGKGTKRKSSCRGPNKRKSEFSEGPNNSNIKGVNTVCHTSSSLPPHHEVESTKSPRRKSARLNPGHSEGTGGVFEALHGDFANPSAPPSADVLLEQSKNEKQNENGVLEAMHEDIAIPLAPPSTDVLLEQSKNEKQNDYKSSVKPSEEQVTGRRSSVGRPSRRAAQKIVSYKEIPLKVKMRRE